MAGALKLNVSVCRSARGTKISRLALVTKERDRTILLSIPNKIHRAIVISDHVGKGLTAIIRVIARNRYDSKRGTSIGVPNVQALAIELARSDLEVTSHRTAVRTIKASKVGLTALEIDLQFAGSKGQLVRGQRYSVAIGSFQGPRSYGLAC